MSSWEFTGSLGIGRHSPIFPTLRRKSLDFTSGQPLEGQMDASANDPIFEWEWIRNDFLRTLETPFTYRRTNYLTIINTSPFLNSSFYALFFSLTYPFRRALNDLSMTWYRVLIPVDPIFAKESLTFLIRKGIPDSLRHNVFFILFYFICISFPHFLFNIVPSFPFFFLSFFPFSEHLSLFFLDNPFFFFRFNYLHTNFMIIVYYYFKQLWLKLTKSVPNEQQYKSLQSTYIGKNSSVNLYPLVLFFFSSFPLFSFSFLFKFIDHFLLFLSIFNLFYFILSKFHLFFLVWK